MLITGPVGDNVVPQLSVTAGSVGITMSAQHEAVAVVGGMAANGSRSIVTVWVHTWALPSQSV